MPTTALLLGRVERAEAALAGDLEDDLRALRDLVERELLAEVLLDEVLGVAVEGLDVRVGLLGAGLVAGDVGVHRRDLLAADRGDDLVAALVLGVERGERADEVAGLVLLEQQAVDVRGLALHRGLRVVDDREVRVGELLGDGLHRLGHQEADADHDVVLLLGQRGQVRHVVRVLDFDVRTRPSTPSSDLARSRPSLASWLNERSLRPPMSVTRPTLIFLPSGVDSELRRATARGLVVATAHGDEAAETEREDHQQMYCATRWHFASLQGKVMGPAMKRRQPTGVTGRSPDLQRREENV